METKGLKELSAILDQFPEKMRRSHITSALRAGGKEVVSAAKSKAQQAREPSSGALAESIGIRARKSRNGGQHRILIGPLRNDKQAFLQYLSFYGISLSSKNAKSGIRHGHLVEFGHSYPGGSVPARPFMRPAMDSQKSRVVAVFRDTLRKRINSTIKRLKKQNNAR